MVTLRDRVRVLDEAVVVCAEPATDTAAIETITPLAAAELLRHNLDNRPLSATVVERYAEDMRQGRWRFNGTSIVVAREPSGRTLLLDGQHRLHAIRKAETSQRLVVVTLAVSSEEAEALFATLDQGRKRSIVDVLFTTERPEMAQSHAALRALAAGIGALAVRVLIREGQGAFMDLGVPQRLALFRAHGDQARWAAGLRERQSRSLPQLPQGLLAAAIDCHEQDAARADAFFEQVLAGEMLKQGQPAYALRQELLAANRRHGRGIASSREQHERWWGLTTSAWQRALAGDEDVRLLRPARTPYTAGKRG
jgi:hypothetical protein